MHRGTPLSVQAAELAQADDLHDEHGDMGSSGRNEITVITMGAFTATAVAIAAGIIIHASART